MSAIIEKMQKSESQLLKQQAEDLAKWSKLRHTKQDLELFLQFNIAEIQFRAKQEIRTILCTSNTTLIKIIAAKKVNDKKQLADEKSDGIRTKDLTSVLTWDLIDKSYKTINLTSWQIINFISIFPSNILLLDEILNKVI